ncbi:uncharacterized protein LOC125943750 isoform X2 [Dermacentor silvarum]|uniref:uncharacterized protein LOC125943750 isoform X2 n=2 Tax=Dermacentor silvarum TaxID=543639 RepID=UPI0021008473|nr:uncharacterized protein LOC125943750 isoform X2 [Dermacentor silvarum]
MKSVEYEVRLELSAHERKIVQAYCTCKAGCRGWWKHGAALALYVNNHQHTSCTDLPCAWQKPSTRPTLDTKKSISELFPSRPIIKPILRPLSPTVVHSQFPDVNCALRHVINFEESCAIEAPDAVVAVAAKQVDESHSDLVKNIFNNVRQLHHNFEVSTTLPLRLTKCDMLSTLSGKKKCFYQSVVSKSMDEVVEIALATRRQASVTRWHTERRLRITSSSAHRIKTRLNNYETLASSLVRPKFFSSAATSYGKQMETEARAELSTALGAVIHEVGLFIHPEQPWLCCSPDGILDSDGRMYLVEIKCPFSLKDKKLIDHEHEESFVPYIHYVNGQLRLKKTHQYYSQMMIMLYILGIGEAFLYIYSSQQSITVCVQRDEAFLAEYVPKLETFYFKHFLSEIVKHT